MDRKNFILGNRRDKWSQITKMNRQCNTKCEKQICIQKLFPLWSTLYSQHFCILLRGGLGVDIWHDATVCGLWGFVQRMSRKCLILIYQPTWFRFYNSDIERRGTETEVRRNGYVRCVGTGTGWFSEFSDGNVTETDWFRKSWCVNGTGK